MNAITHARNIFPNSCPVVGSILSFDKSLDLSSQEPFSNDKKHNPDTMNFLRQFVHAIMGARMLLQNMARLCRRDLYDGPRDRSYP